MINEKGFSIVEALVGVALLGGLAAGLMQLSSSGYKLDKDLNNRNALREFNDEMRLILSAENCGLKDDPMSSLARASIVMDSSDANEIKELLGPQDQNILPGNSYYGFMIGDSSAPAISLAPPSKTDGPFLSNLSKNAGGYPIIDLVHGIYVGEIRISVKESTSNMKTKITRHLAKISVTPAGVLTECKFLGDLSQAAQSCITISGGNVTANWNEETLQCELTHNQNQANTILDFNDPGGSVILPNVPQGG